MVLIAEPDRRKKHKTRPRHKKVCSAARIIRLQGNLNGRIILGCITEIVLHIVVSLRSQRPRDFRGQQIRFFRHGAVNKLQTQSAQGEITCAARQFVQIVNLEIMRTAADENEQRHHANQVSIQFNHILCLFSSCSSFAETQRRKVFCDSPPLGNRTQKESLPCDSREAVRIAYGETRREETQLRFLHSAVTIEISHVSLDDRFAVAN